jgi:hypothetical protein
MKTVSNKMRNVLTVVLIIALMVLSKYSFADTSDRDRNKATPVQVKHIGTVNGSNLIEVSIDNAAEEMIEISFIDNDGVELFKDEFNDKKIAKKFLLDIPKSSISKLKLIVTTKKKTQTQSFAISKDDKVVELNVTVLN